LVRKLPLVNGKVKMTPGDIRGTRPQTHHARTSCVFTNPLTRHSLVAPSVVPKADPAPLYHSCLNPLTDTKCKLWWGCVDYRRSYRGTFDCEGGCGLERYCICTVADICCQDGTDVCCQSCPITHMCSLG
jgi:hypothetical protein